MLERVFAQVDAQSNQYGREGNVSVNAYIDRDRLGGELDTLFRAFPIIAGHSSQLAEPGQFITVTIGRVPTLVIRDRNNVLRAFVNACRHRGARLVDSEQGRAKAFVCPYHGWTYRDDGRLSSIPRAETFPSLASDPSQCALAPLAVAEAGGFVWVQPHGSIDLPRWLGELEADLDQLRLAEHRVHRTDVQRPGANWKLVIDAFSEGYHVRTLHKDSVRRFFSDHGLVSDRIEAHSRSVGARIEMESVGDLPRSQWDFRAWTTSFYNLFPNTILVLHPDWVSRISVFPDGTDACVAVHQMLVPADSPIEDRLWDKRYALINDVVFGAEDLRICESVQGTARSGADVSWRTGGMETGMLWFHEACDAALAGSGPDDLASRLPPP